MTAKYEMPYSEWTRELMLEAIKEVLDENQPEFDGRWEEFSDSELLSNFFGYSALYSPERFDYKTAPVVADEIAIVELAEMPYGSWRQ